jgi:hypothetical protein
MESFLTSEGSWQIHVYLNRKPTPAPRRAGLALQGGELRIIIPLTSSWPALSKLRRYFSSVPLHHCTAAPLHHCTIAPLHSCTVIPLNRCTNKPFLITHVKIPHVVLILTFFYTFVPIIKTRSYVREDQIYRRGA